MIYDCQEPMQAICNDLLFQGGYLEPELRRSYSVQHHWVKCNLSISSWRLYDKNIVLLTLKTRSTNSWFVGTMQWWNLEIPNIFEFETCSIKEWADGIHSSSPFRHFTCLIHLYFNWRLHGIIRSFSFVESSGSDLRSLDIQNPPNIWWLGVWNP